MARGGKRTPKPGQPPSGPGRFSRRTDGNQAPKAPDLDNPSMQFGDVQRLTDAQRIAPIPQAGSPSPQGGLAGLRGSAPGQGQGLPPWLFQMGSANPGEPITAGLDMGAGPGSEMLSTPPERDERQAVLEYLALTYGNADAAAMLTEMRGAAQAPSPVMPGGPPPEPPPAPPGMGEALMDEAPVEEPLAEEAVR